MTQRRAGCFTADAMWAIALSGALLAKERYDLAWRRPLLTATATKPLFVQPELSLRSLVAALAFVLLTIACTLPALAHASLLSAQPADGSVLAEAPTELVLTFNEPVSPLAVLLVGLDGATSPLDAVSAVGNTITIELPADQVAGTQVISWRAISADGHPIAGTTSFSLGAASTGPVAVDGVVRHSDVAALLWIARIVFYIGLFFGAGGAAFRALSPTIPEPARRLSRATALAGMGAALLIIGLQGLDILGLGFGDLTQGEVWNVGVTSVYGQTSVVALVALGVKSDAFGKSMGVIAVLLVGLAITLSGHASAAQPQWLMKPALFVHMVAIAWWVGALYPLALLLRADPGVATPAMLKFSRAIPFAVGPLVVSGAVLSVVQLGPPGPAWMTGYGLILAGKLVALAALFAVACWNRFKLTTPAAAGDAGAIRRMRRAILGEILLILAILCLVSGWRFTPPPRALALEQPGVVELNLAQRDLFAAVRMAPAKAGPVDFNIGFATTDGAIVTPKAVRISLTLTGSDLAPTTRSASADAVGEWSVDAVPLLVAGDWTLEIEVRVTDFELVRFNGEIAVLP